ncbi:MAG: YkgJ family cysteine cluster protein [archaeon]
MPLVPVTKKTRWECQQCGKCCRGVIVSKRKSLSIIKDGSPICKFLSEDNLCTNYKERPFICRAYPFVPDYDKMRGEDGVARPDIGFSMDNMKIHTECSGYGKGKRIVSNKRLLKQIDDLRYDFAVNLKKAVDKNIEPNEII